MASGKLEVWWGDSEFRVFWACAETCLGAPKRMIWGKAVQMGAPEVRVHHKSSKAG